MGSWSTPSPEKVPQSISSPPSIWIDVTRLPAVMTGRTNSPLESLPYLIVPYGMPRTIELLIATWSHFRLTPSGLISSSASTLYDVGASSP